MHSQIVSITLFIILELTLGNPQYQVGESEALTEEQKNQLKDFWSKVEGAFGGGGNDVGNAIGNDVGTDIVHSQCGHDSYDCVPYFQCVDGVINTDGEGLIDIRIRPQATCVNPDYPDVPALCCLIPGHTATPAPLETCPAHDECVEYSQCSKDGFIVTDGAGLIDIRSSTKSRCYLPDGKLGVCCTPPPNILEYCTDSVCLSHEECLGGKALDISNNFVDFVNTGAWTKCSLQYDNLGVCCIVPPKVVDYCPTDSLCLHPSECLEGTALDYSNNFINYHADGKWLECSSGVNQPHGICCIQPPPKILDYCLTGSICTAPSECLGTALNDLGNFVDYTSSGLWSHCKVDEYGTLIGVCCIPPPPKILDYCPSNSICVEHSKCLGTALNDLDAFIPYDVTLNSWAHCNLGSNYEPGLCCINPKTPILKPADQCGVRNYQVDQRIQAPHAENEAGFAEFPWQTILFYQNYTFNCGASLISNKHVVTAAHCVYQRLPHDLNVRFGEWQVNSFDEPLPYEDHFVKTIIVHPHYNPRNVHNDIAILELTEPILLNYHINTVCIPPLHQEFKHGDYCIATGWGKSSFTGKFQHILKKIDLPFVSHSICQSLLRKTRLGKYFRLHDSFVCAGGEENKDACYGDGGGPLVCNVNGQYFLAGITAWGIGCGAKDVPGVYAKVSKFSTWIDEIVLGTDSGAVAGYGK